MVETELVLPVAPGDPQVHEVGVLRTQNRLGGVEGKADRLAVEFGLGGGGRTCRDVQRRAASSRPRAAATALWLRRVS